MNTNRILKLSLILGAIGFASKGDVFARSSCVTLKQCATSEYNTAIARGEFDKISELNKKWKPIFDCCKENNNEWSVCANNKDWDAILKKCDEE